MPLPMPKPPLMDIQRLQCENPPKPHPRGRSIASRTAKPGARHLTHAPTYATPPEPLPFPDCKNHLTHPRMPRHTQAAKSSDASQPPTLFQQATHARAYVSRQNRSPSHDRTRRSTHPRMPGHTQPARTTPNPQPTAATDPARMPGHTQPDTSSTIRRPPRRQARAYAYPAIHNPSNPAMSQPATACHRVQTPHSSTQLTESSQWIWG
ncbi:hypothetical protein BPORC_1071 [Bifidobacterium porcinum]|nr:hypothetical protein BPORC_1071 [Bifidobacterium porcinum]